MPTTQRDSMTDGYDVANFREIVGIIKVVLCNAMDIAPHGNIGSHRHVNLLNDRMLISYHQYTINMPTIKE